MKPKAKFGEFLLNEDKVKIKDLMDALRIQIEQRNENYKKLGEILVENKKLQEDELVALLEKYNESR